MKWLKRLFGSRVVKTIATAAAGGAAMAAQEALFQGHYDPSHLGRSAAVGAGLAVTALWVPRPAPPPPEPPRPPA